MYTLLSSSKFIHNLGGDAGLLGMSLYTRESNTYVCVGISGWLYDDDAVKPERDEYRSRSFIANNSFLSVLVKLTFPFCCCILALWLLTFSLFCSLTGSLSDCMTNSAPSPSKR